MSHRVALILFLFQGTAMGGIVYTRHGRDMGRHMVGDVFDPNDEWQRYCDDLPLATFGKVHVVGEGEIRMHAESGMGGAITGPARIVFGEEHQRRWQGDDVGRALSALFPDGVPSRDQLSDADLVDKVRSYMREQIDEYRSSGGRPACKPLPHPDTILRAAGRIPRRKPRKR
jgi:hypothetical protein